MDMYDFSTCIKCDKSYLGHFKVDMYGNISCVDCKHPEMLSERLTIESMDKSTYEQYMVMDMLDKDISVLYPLFAQPTDVPLEKFINEEGELIPEKVYFQGNDLDTARHLQEMSLICLKYLDTNKIEHLDLVNQIIKGYLNLREVKYTEEQMNSLNELVLSPEFKMVEDEVKDTY